MRDSVSEIKKTIQNSTNFLNNNVQKTEKKIIEKVQKQEKNSFTKLDVFSWAGCFLLGMFLCFVIVQQFTDKLLQTSYQSAIQKSAEEPRKEAEAEAKRILEQARKEAKAIIQEAQKRAEENK